MDPVFKGADIQPGLSDVSAELQSQLRDLGLNGSHRRFLVNRMGGTGSSWLVKLLNSHPDVFCYHEGVIVRTYPASSYGTDDVVSFIRWLAYDDMKGAYKAVGDVGSAWIGHLISLPKELFTTAILLRHPARILNSRLGIYQTDQSFTKISEEYLRHIENTWGIHAVQLSEMDQIFLQDLCNLKTQIDAASSVDIVLQLELMTIDINYCQDVLGKLTGRFYERALVEPMLNSAVNRRTQSAASIRSVLDGFTEQQRSWYRLILQNSVAKVGYELDNELPASYLPSSAVVGASVQQSVEPCEQELNVLKQVLVDRDHQIAHLEHIWTSVQNSAGWRLMNLWRRTLKRLLPDGTRARRVYDSVLRRFRGSTVVNP